ncbi:MAG: lipopolysaccharide biosynthesis protein [Coriobacteriia bacterium]|nr:lipopolysaccharide biosynthesis protein [Coriobacteriia bacterium]
MTQDQHSPVAAVRGMRDASLGRAGQQVLQFAFTIALVRLLDPGDFGIVALCSVITGFITLLGDLGTSAAIVQRKELNPRLLSSVWVLNVGVGVGAAALLIVGSGPLAAALGNPHAAPVIRGLALVFPIRSLALVHGALLQRDLRFNTVARSEVYGTLAGGLSAVGVALLGWGPWSLVVQQMVATTVSGAVMAVGARWLPRARPSRAELRGIASFTANLSAYNTVYYAARNADNLLIGRFLGTGALGVYDIGYRTILYPLRNVTNVVSTVAYPVLSRRQDDDPGLLRGYLRIVRSIALVTFPMLAIMAFLSPEFVGVVYGPKWADLVPVLAVLAPVGALQSVTSTVIILYQSKARTDLLLRVGLVESAVIVGGFVVGLRWGVLGVAVSYLVTNLLLLYPVVRIPMGLVHARASDFFAATWKPAVLAAIAGVCAYAAGLWPPLHSASLVVQLIVLSAVGAGVYAALGLAFLRDDVDWLAARIREALGR